MKTPINIKRALVTGGTRGIGKAIALRLEQDGFEVLITGRSCPEWMSGHLRIRYVAVDFLDDRSFEAFLVTLEGLPDISVLINNAGIHIPETTINLNDENWIGIHTVNVLRPMQLSRTISRRMLQNGGGWILNISSVAGLISSARSAAYSASKSALLGLTRAMALDLASGGILVNSLCPGTTETDMVEKLLDAETKQRFLNRIPLGRFASPAEVAEAAFFLVSSENTYITGQILVVDGGTVIQ